jgi:hypothetical protein
MTVLTLLRPPVTLCPRGERLRPAMPRLHRILLGALALASLALVGTVWRQEVELRRLRALLERPSAPVAHTRAGDDAARPAGSTLSRIAARPLTRPSSVAPAPEREDDFTLPTPAATPPAKRKPSGLARLMADPEFMRAFTATQEGALDARFAALFRQLNLNAEELTAFKRLLVEKDSVALDVVAISQETPGGPLPASELRSSIAAAQSQVENAIQASLGNDRYAVYREFERTLAQRAVVARLEQRLSYTPTPLQPSQAEALVHMLAKDAPPDTAATRPALAVLPTSGSSEGPPIVHAGPVAVPIPEDAIIRSNAVLSPPQVVALRQIQGELLAGSAAARLFNSLVPQLQPDDEILPGLRVLMQ